MRKIVLFLIAAVIAALSFTACTDEQLKTVETTYSIGENTVKTFVPEDTREKLGLKEKNEFVKDTYESLKPSMSEAKE